MLTPVPALATGFPLHPDDPDDPYAFRVDLTGEGLITVKVVFSQNEPGRTTAVHLDLMPLTALKRGGPRPGRVRAPRRAG
jgi:hypothetical protein